MALVAGGGGGGGFAGKNMGLRFKTGDDFRRQAFDEDPTCGCSRMSTVKKTAKLSKVQLLKERIRQFSIWYCEQEDHKDAEHFKLRVERKMRKRRFVKDRYLRWLRWLYIFDALVWVAGGVLTLCSTVETVGKNTIFYERRHFYQILGPCVMFCGVLILFSATGIKHSMRAKYHKQRRNFYIKDKSGLSKVHLVDQTDSRESTASLGSKPELEMKLLRTSRNSSTRSSVKSRTDTPVNFYLESETVAMEKSSANAEVPNADVSSMARERRAHTKVNRSEWSKAKWMRNESSQSLEYSEDVAAILATSALTPDVGNPSINVPTSSSIHAQDVTLCRNIPLERTDV